MTPTPPDGAPEAKEKWRANYVPAPLFYNMNQACTVIRAAYGAVLYLVGSSLTRKDWRDVDVQLVLDAKNGGGS